MKRILNNCFYTILVITSLWSCDHFETKKISSSQYLAQDWEALNLNEVDGYPTFDSCTTVSEGPELKTCFETTIADTFYEAFNTHQIIVTRSLNETVTIHFIVDEKGLYCIEKLDIAQEIREEIPQLDLWIYEATQSLPKAKPATKEGIPVKTRFEIPVVLQVD